MINQLYDFILNRLSGSESVKTLGVPRSKYWAKTRNEFLKSHPCCEVCGSNKFVVPHHIIPFYIDPSLELDSNNLIALCETKSFNCHLFFGHLKNYKHFNPNIVQDVKYLKNMFNNRNKIIS